MIEERIHNFHYLFQQQQQHDPPLSQTWGPAFKYSSHCQSPFWVSQRDFRLERGEEEEAVVKL